MKFSTPKEPNLKMAIMIAKYMTQRHIGDVFRSEVIRSFFALK